MKQLVKTTSTPKDWKDNLHAACLNGEDQRFAISLVNFRRMGISERSPMQMLVIQNLVSKLQRANNNHSVDFMKDIRGKKLTIDKSNVSVTSWCHCQGKLIKYAISRVTKSSELLICIS